ncbi:hypothetical protein HQ81_0175 [Dickeya phage phiDP23.1]|uniref:Uncharacterized protein n=10 Tax=Aglimvirinae TaxID=2169530 RepID=I0J374_9CAUD|nr:hypothetical protein G379_gp032 [Dickeya phage vB-DsoM-LIMEstone1]YP_009103001.1 hypothetical protein DA66_0162 [Dickeya phage RC-2014]AIM51382.1 hypothetical protein HQ80_0004 [Dickeya phage phiD3]AIM51650.1 hypothetical protein HQ82_0048 [Dickeya phage phiDP10.3]AIM51939.1 hypothetical protein HQ81_0175 [Dickeya phage phiDP23.1]ASD51385.1 hypothetical protein [Dickeya phage JA15]ASD51581.1 hypothetical protein [Dickeya phage XF4]ATW62202.1 hypothetical protein [Dickeya phage PP35]AYN55
MERTSANVSEERLKDLSIGNPKLARSWVMFEEGKMMADEIIFLRAEVARLSKTEPEK